MLRKSLLYVHMLYSYQSLNTLSGTIPAILLYLFSAKQLVSKLKIKVLRNFTT